MKAMQMSAVPFLPLLARKTHLLLAEDSQKDLALEGE